MSVRVLLRSPGRSERDDDFRNLIRALGGACRSDDDVGVDCGDFEFDRDIQVFTTAGRAKTLKTVRLHSLMK